MLVETEIANEAGQAIPVALSLMIDHVRMRPAGHQVDDLRVGGRDGRQGPNRHLEALGGGDEAEGGEHGLIRTHRNRLVPEGDQIGHRLVAAVIAPGGLAQHVRRTVRNHAYAVRVRQPLRHHHPLGRLGEHHDAIGAVTERAQGARTGPRTARPAPCAG